VPTPIPYVRDIDVEPGRADRLSPLIRRVVAPNPGKFTGTGTGTYLVGRGEVAVIDPGPGLAGHLDAVLAALEPGERVTTILVTHTHSDHSPGAAGLQERHGLTALLLLTTHHSLSRGAGPVTPRRCPDPR
jgi:glyoxylase-like metal-dependent hydrolase (beta-lactamase superfamily II)